MSAALRLTIDQYEAMIQTGAFDRLDHRVELIEGELRQMSPANIEHDDYLTFLLEWSFRNTTQAELQVRSQMGLRVGESMPEPDLVWLKSSLPRFVRPAASDTLLLIEIAYTSREYDLGEKADLYARGGIPEYWVVDVTDHCVHCHREPDDGLYQQITVHHPGEQLRPLAAPAAELDLADLFAGSPT